MSDAHDLAGIGRLLSRLRILANAASQQKLLDRLARPRAPTVVSFLNQHGFNLAWTDPAFRERLLRSDVLLRDGVGVALGLRLLARDPGLNANGTDLIPKIVAAYAGRRVALIGTREPYLEQAARYLREQGADVVCALDGFGDQARYLPAVSAARPDLVILGMGMPKQERIAAELAAAADRPMLIVNGGAILDFLAGRFPRAPQWMRQARLEWLYRLGREPRRLWRRYLLGGGQFIARVARLGWSSDLDSAAAARSADTDTPLPEIAAMNPQTPPLFAQTDASVTQLLHRVDASMGETRERIVQFVAARSGEGTSTLAYSYACASARLGKRRVLLLSDDLDGETAVASLAGTALGTDAPPIASSAVGTVSFARLCDPERSYQDNYAALGESAAWSALAEAFDEIVVDARPPFALAAARHAAGVIVVVEAEVTRASLLRKLLDDLSAVEARVLGSVLNKHRSHLPYALHERL
ncbi:WecB/TagA/CpsF family glycosyltransferase [Pseudomonas sp. CGJS7]|uniref:WecB/TagA/CpsF family glycosyltransferase n=1 Tax=Pseudomonas sp. CGJS7 TaxID=3109348 RepID=UPI00300BA517